MRVDRFVGLMLCAVAMSWHAPPAHAQTDQQRWLHKQERQQLIEAEGPLVRSILPEDRSTGGSNYLGIKVVQGGFYNPSIDPDVQWFEIACVRDDLRQQYSRTKHGFSLIPIHALFWDKYGDQIYDSTDEGMDYGICSVDSTIDTTFIELPRRLRPVRVALIIVPRSNQKIHATELEYRQLPRR